MHTVAPRVGAWIETENNKKTENATKSHPVWVRGLKLFGPPPPVNKGWVAPRVGAWIETYKEVEREYYDKKSHPVWVRGLKPDLNS